MTPIMLNLAELRQRVGMTQAELAQRVGCIQATISNLETGKSKRISFDLLDKLVDALRCQPGDLLVKQESPPKPIRVVCDGRTYEIEEVMKRGMSTGTVRITDVDAGRCISREWCYFPIHVVAAGDVGPYEKDPRKVDWCREIAYLKANPGSCGPDM